MKTKKRLPHFDGLYGELNNHISADYIFSELISTRSRDFGWIIKPHFHTRLYQLFFVQSGRVLIKLANEEREVYGPCIFLIPPLAMHGLTYAPDVKGHILTISDTIAESLFQSSSPVITTISSPHIIQEFDSGCPFEHALRLIMEIDRELFQDWAEKRLMLQAHLTQLFILLHRLLQMEIRNELNLHPSLAKFNLFQKMLRTSAAQKSIAQFANELHVSAIHLSRITRNITGKPPLQLVHEHLIEESKKYLIHTSHSVSEIADILNFKYPNYFARLFKKYTRKSPTGFRREQRSIQL
jgi:AraC family transcriptional activator of pobA